jgi:hypothetical protein
MFQLFRLNLAVSAMLLVTFAIVARSLGSDAMGALAPPFDESPPVTLPGMARMSFAMVLGLIRIS